MPELTWDGKYDKHGRKVAPLRVSLPFQTVESVNESAQERQQALDFLERGREAEWRNRLIWGDKKYILPALVNELGGKVDLAARRAPVGDGEPVRPSGLARRSLRQGGAGSPHLQGERQVVARSFAAAPPVPEERTS